ncbi:MAG: zinc ribbon domain-containing protein [Asgard group archaeon]|nr:zinc ribbon domain-containing protein [Asgard group archaeon]
MKKWTQLGLIICLLMGVTILIMPVSGGKNTELNEGDWVYWNISYFKKEGETTANTLKTGVKIEITSIEGNSITFNYTDYTIEDSEFQINKNKTLEKLPFGRNQLAINNFPSIAELLGNQWVINPNWTEQGKIWQNFSQKPGLYYREITHHKLYGLKGKIRNMYIFSGDFSGSLDIDGIFGELEAVYSNKNGLLASLKIICRNLQNETIMDFSAKIGTSSVKLDTSYFNTIVYTISSYVGTYIIIGGGIVSYYFIRERYRKYLDEIAEEAKAEEEEENKEKLKEEKLRNEIDNYADKDRIEDFCFIEKCPYCGEDISIDEKVCPHCGGKR